MIRSIVIAFGFAFVLTAFACGDDVAPPPRYAVKDASPLDATMIVPDSEAADTGPACVNLQCKQVTCASGSETTVSGAVYAPNGTLPIYNAIVYVPNTPVAPAVKGVTCDKCGTVASGTPLVSALTDAAGKFKLEKVPVGESIPLVIQLGKWRRQIMVPTVTKCIDTPLDKNVTRLPRNQSEGDLPKIAVTTGACDQGGCILPKLGIDPAEIGTEADGAARSVHVFTNPKPFWSDLTKLKQYDLSIFSCECSESLGSKDAISYKAVTDYLAAGGRVLTSDFQYTWYRSSPDPALSSVSNITGGAPLGTSPFYLNDSFPKGKALADWLQLNAPGAAYGEISADATFDNFKNLVDKNKAQVWASETAGGLGHTRVFSVNTPVGAKPEEQCGKAMHFDAHANSTDSFPNMCNTPLKRSEALFAFMFLDLASCIQKEGAAPIAPK
jgi:hypothetical protein